MTKVASIANTTRAVESGCREWVAAEPGMKEVVDILSRVLTDIGLDKIVSKGIIREWQP